jgi:acetyl-CoA carboxylase carboxyl transferase beta subunit
MRFRKPANVLEGDARPLKPTIKEKRHTPHISCPKCKKTLIAEELQANMKVCPYCRHHFRIKARARLALICDEGTFQETDGNLTARDVLSFPGYPQKLAIACEESGENEAVICGSCEIGGSKAAIFVMEPDFMMGSMGSVVGEKITRLFELASENGLPVVGFTVSGGARMQEGILSLMQMAKTSGAVQKHSAEGNLYLCVLTDPTTGGVTASFAMEADILIAEPQALIGFTGPRVIEQTTRKKLPEGFQKAEFVLEKGFLDDIVDRRRQKAYISQLLHLHQRGASA